MDGYAHRFIYPLITLDYYQGLIYVVVFSITGVLAVGRKDVDLFGVVMLGLITALGGGTIRDILLDIRVFWIQDFNYVWVGALAALVAFFGVRNFGLQALYRPLLYLDAVGVALFCVQTIDRVLAMKRGAPVAVLMGMILGIGGGLVAGRPGRQADPAHGPGDLRHPAAPGRHLICSVAEMVPAPPQFTGGGRLHDRLPLGRHPLGFVVSPVLAPGIRAVNIFTRRRRERREYLRMAEGAAMGTTHRFANPNPPQAVGLS